MRKNVYAIYDRATMTYSDPFYAFNDEDCFRAVRGAFAPNSQLVLYPSDYVVCVLGCWDSNEGSLVASCPSEVKEIKNLIPVGLRKCALDGTFNGGEIYEEKKDSAAQS